MLRELGLVVSVGAAPNRLMAKLASAAAKPDGVRVVGCQQEAVQLLSQVRVCLFLSPVPSCPRPAAPGAAQSGVGGG